MSDPLPESNQTISCNCPCRRWTFVLLGLAIILGVVVAIDKYRAGHNAQIGPPLLRADAKDLKNTHVTPHLEAPIQPGKNVLWCSTFQLVWNEACRAAGGDLRLQDEPPMVPILNKKTAQASEVDPGSCLVMSGMLQEGIVGKIRKALDAKFAVKADPDLLNRIEPGLPQEGWLGYAYLFRSLPFERPFKRLQEPLEFGSAKVASFGLRDLKGRMDELRTAEQVDVLDYRNEDDFVIELKPQERSERIILAKIAPAETLDKTIEAVASRIASTKLEQWDQMLMPNESLVVPILNFDLWQEYEELYRKITTPGPLADMPIVLAVQDIRFRLDERGAILKSEAALAAAACEAGRKPRQFIFDKPFLILLERRGASRPYFALWVDNPELLTPWK